MKKLFLSFVLLTIGVLTSMADVFTLDLNGEGDAYGLTRYTNPGTPLPLVSNFQKELSIETNGINFNFKSVQDGGRGIGLVNCKNGTNTASNAYYYQGIVLLDNDSICISIKVPGGKITGAKITASGHVLYTKDFYFNQTEEDPAGNAIDGVRVSGMPTQSNMYQFTWNDANYDKDEITMAIIGPGYSTPAYFYYIHEIELTYTENMSGKEPAGLSFPVETATGIMGREFKAPVLSNPNNLPIVWTSSDENVATVDENGNITLINGGTTTIKAATDGNDSYGKGNVQYSLTVIGEANNIPDLFIQAPKESNRVVVNFPMTVTYARKGDAYVIDAENNATLVHNPKNDGATESSGNVYTVGDIIPAGWVATNGTQYNVVWNGAPDADGSTTVTYPVVESINYDTDAYKVVIMKDVVFEKGTPYDTGKRTGVAPDGQGYEFQDTYEIGEYPAGTYDVTLIVRHDIVNGKAYNWLAAINFAAVQADPVVPESYEIAVSNENINITQGIEDEVYTVNAKGETDEDTYTVTFKIPEGWDGYVIYVEDGTINPDVQPFKANAIEWVDINTIMSAMGMQKANQFTFDADGNEHIAKLMLYKGDQVDVNNTIEFYGEVTKKAVAVDPVFPESFKVNLDVEGLTVNQYDYDGVWQIAVSGETNRKQVAVTVQIPEGWDGFLTISDGDINPEEIMPFAMKATSPDEIEWVPVATILASMPLQKGNQITFDVDGDEHFGRMMLYKGDMANTSDNIELSFQATYKETVGVETIEAVDADARYFNLQGVEVANPAEGIYVKIANGVATKVIIK